MARVGHKQLIEILTRYQERKNYNALKKASEKAVVEWRWATGPMVPKLPHDKTIYGRMFAPEKWATKRPRDGYEHGLDAEGHIRVIRSESMIGNIMVRSDQYVIPEKAGFWQIFFSEQKRPAHVEWYEFRDGQWVRELSISFHSVHETTLDWEAGRLVRHILRVWEGINTEDPKAAAKAKFSKVGSQHIVFDYSYAPDGTLERATETTFLGDETEPCIQETKYQKLRKGVSLESLLDEVEKMLADEIPKTIRAAKLKGAFYGVLLQFSGVDTDTGGFAPPLFLVPEKQRAEILAERPQDVPYLLWSIAELEMLDGTVRLACNNPAIDEKLEQVFQLTIRAASKSNYAPVRKMFQRVCKRLNGIEWKGILHTTDDFVVFPVDTHGEFDMGQDMKASVPAARLQLLRKRSVIKGRK